MILRDATAQDVPQILGGFSRETPRMPKRHSRTQGLGGAGLAKVKVSGLMRIYTCQANQKATAFGLRKVQQTDGMSNDEKLPDVWMEWRG